MSVSLEEEYAPDRCGADIWHFAASVLESLWSYVAFKVSEIAASIFGGVKPVLHSESAWYENLSLMLDCQERTNSPELKNRIRFLAVNYLNKVAPLETDAARMIGWKFFEEAFQVSPFSSYQYHRAFFRYQPELSSGVNQRFALGDESPLLLTDTPHFAHLLPLKFTVLQLKDKEQWGPLIQEALEQQGDLLFDFTEELEGVLLTEGDKEKEDQFCAQFEEIKRSINGWIAEQSNPELLRKFLKEKSASIARVGFACQGEQIGAMKILPLFTPLSPSTVIEKHSALARHFVEETGIALGAIQLRRLVPEGFSLPESTSVTYSLCKGLFKDTLEGLEKKLNSKPHVEVMGQSLVKMLKGFMQKVDAKTWKTLDRDPATYEIVRTVFSWLVAHLHQASRAMDDEVQYLNAIELAHAELATLLELTLPYSAKDFEPIYLQQLHCVPEGLKPYLKAGLGKTAETVFAEANVALHAMQPHPIRAHSCGFYFEHASLLGTDKELPKVLDASDRIDFYGCNFNPGVEAKRTHYSLNPLISEIQAILAKNNGKPLTIALDFTNDYVNSPKTEELLKTFERAIHDGTLNVILFGSGQKFDMLGMDHFYGSPFYTIHNGASHWKPFDTLFSPLNQTDRLSTQWFCLLYEFAPEANDAFRRHYFNNSRYILDRIPQSLSPLANRTITVSTVDPAADATFIDVKVSGLFHSIKACFYIASFYLHCLASKVTGAIRGSFGFLHPNATLIFGQEATTVRLHPGLSPTDNRPILNFIYSLA